ncbi:GYF domain-containing protein, partial [Bosea sp. TAB14]|uniref:GYF domain-containing protein n=1 Tax=Bosea sp. TAB14 TaxID=3237481 RepID=UPI003F923BEA
MSDWYYEKNGERSGPISADELKAMLASGAISLTSLVWTATFGSEWKRIGATELAPPQPVLPPPLPPREPPALPPKPEQATSGPEGFLDSALTKVMIGPKHDHYLGKWRSILAKANGDTAKVATVASWNWPALVVPYAWLLYRKLHVLGVIVLVIQIAYVLLPESVPPYVSRGFTFGYLGLCIAIALYGNSWYFDAVRKWWEALQKEPDQAAALERARKTGGVTWIAPIGAVALVIAAAVLPHVITWSDDEAIVRNGFMTGYQSTTIGQALAASFDDAKWQSFTTDKGAKVVSFTGKINASLHANAVDRLMRPVRETAADPDLNVRYGSYERLLAHYETALAYLKVKNRLQPLWDKHGCEQPPGQPATCDVMVAHFTLMREAVEAWADDAYWSVGEPVEIQWTIN